MGSTNVSTPSPPPQPSGAEAVTEWANQLPSIYQTQLQYEPQLLAQQLAMQSQMSSGLMNQYMQQQQSFQPEMMELQMQLQNQYAPELMQQQMELQKQYQPELMRQQYDLQKEYMPQMARLEQQTAQELYPETAGLQEQLATRASQGMNERLPSWMKDEYMSNMRANLGEQALSPLGSDTMSRGLMQLGEDWNRYYQNLGLQVGGRQPLTQVGSVQVPGVQTPQVQGQQFNAPQYQGSNWTQGFTPNSTWGNMNQGYGSYSNLYGSMYGANAGLQSSQNQMMGQMVGGMMGGIGAAGGMSNFF